MPFYKVKSGSEVETKTINIESGNKKQSPADDGDEMDERKVYHVIFHVKLSFAFGRLVPFFWAHYSYSCHSKKKKNSNLKCQPLQEQRPELGSKAQPRFSALPFSNENPSSVTPFLSIHLHSSHPLQSPSHLSALNRHFRGDGLLHQPR